MRALVAEAAVLRVARGSCRYHHGEESLAATIVGMAQDFVGANNLPLLTPVGQFGTRHVCAWDNLMWITCVCECEWREKRGSRGVCVYVADVDGAKLVKA